MATRHSSSSLSISAYGSRNVPPAQANDLNATSFSYEERIKDRCPFVKLTNFPIDFSPVYMYIQDNFPELGLKYKTHGRLPSSVTYTVRWNTNPVPSLPDFTVDDVEANIPPSLSPLSSSSSTTVLTMILNFRRDIYPRMLYALRQIQEGRRLELTMEDDENIDHRPTGNVTTTEDDNHHNTTESIDDHPSSDTASVLDTGTSVITNTSTVLSHQTSYTNDSRTAINQSHVQRYRLSIVDVEDSLFWPESAKGQLIGRYFVLLKGWEKRLHCRIDPNKLFNKIAISASTPTLLENAKRVLLNYRYSIDSTYLPDSLLHVWRCSLPAVAFIDMFASGNSGRTFREGFLYGKITGRRGKLKHDMQRVYRVTIRYSNKHQMVTVKGSDEENVRKCATEIRLLMYAYKYTADLLVDTYPTIHKGIEPIDMLDFPRSFLDANMRKIGSLLETVYTEYGVHLGIYSDEYESEFESTYSSIHHDTLDCINEEESIDDEDDDGDNDDSDEGDADEFDDDDQDDHEDITNRNLTVDVNRRGTTPTTTTTVSSSEGNPTITGNDAVPTGAGKNTDISYSLVYASKSQMNIHKALNYFHRRLQQWQQQDEENNQ